MKSSIAYTQTLNIIIVFIVVVFSFMLSALTYYKAYKVSNSVAQVIEKYEGYNELSEQKILETMKSLGYNSGKLNCSETLENCSLIDANHSKGTNGYCAYKCTDSTDSAYYYYKVTTGLFINIPIVNNLVTAKVSTVTDRIYDFETNLSRGDDIE